MPKTPKPKKTKTQRSEEEIVTQYAKTLVDNYKTRGMVSDRFEHLKSTKTVNKDLWKDADFFFSVVFQSSEQKTAFLEFLQNKFAVPSGSDKNQSIQIVNGLIFAEKLGCSLKKEVASEYPCGNIDLRKFVLDDEAL